MIPSILLLALAVLLALAARSIGRRTREFEAILATLGEFGEMTGLELVKRGVASRGSVYVRLNELAQKGLVKSRLRFHPIANEQRVYAITNAGVDYLADGPDAVRAGSEAP